MAFGRKKRKNEEAEDEPAGASAGDTAAEPADGASAPVTDTHTSPAPLADVDEPEPVATPVDQPTTADPSPDEPAASGPSVGGDPLARPGPADEPVVPEHSPASSDEPAVPEGDSPAPASGRSDDFVEASASAGDAAAAGIDAEGPGASAPHGSAVEGAGPEGSSSSGASATAERTDAENLGSVAASPDPVAVPAGYGGEEHAGAHSDAEADKPDLADRAGAATSGVEALIESRPEVLVAGAFAAGLVVARILGALGGNR